MAGMRSPNDMSATRQARGHFFLEISIVIKILNNLRDLTFVQLCCWRFIPSRTLCNVDCKYLLTISKNFLSHEMESLRSFEEWVNVYQSTRCNFSEALNLH